MSAAPTHIYIYMQQPIYHQDTSKGPRQELLLPDRVRSLHWLLGVPQERQIPPVRLSSYMHTCKYTCVYIYIYNYMPAAIFLSLSLSLSLSLYIYICLQHSLSLSVSLSHIYLSAAHQALRNMRPGNVAHAGWCS